MLYLDNRESAVNADSYLYYRSKDDKGYLLPKLFDNEIIFTQNLELRKVFPNKDIRILSQFLGFKEDIGLYELFSFFFEGKVQDDFDMLEALFNGLLIDSEWCFILKIGVTFCWFKVNNDSLIKLGTMQFSEAISKYTVGKFIKRLRYKVVKSGVNLNKIKFLVWSMEDLNYEFSNYIVQYDCLNTFFSRIEGFKGLSIENVMHFLSKKAALKFNVTAETFVDCLNDSFSNLNLSEENGILISRGVFYKDYSCCTSSIIDEANCSYGIIIDCEGKLGINGDIKAGCRELGGLIFCQYKNIMTCVDTFYCDELLLEDTLLQVIKNYKDFTSPYIKYINVFCFGTSDQQMLTSSINELCSKKSIKLFSDLFNYIDCRNLILNYLDNREIIVDGKNTLTNIAKALGVKPVFPKHKPLNDAKTLFNILAQILMTTEKIM